MVGGIKMAKAIGICKEDKNKIEVYSADEVDDLIEALDAKTVTHISGNVWKMSNMIFSVLKLRSDISIAAGKTETVSVDATSLDEIAQAYTECVFPTIVRGLNDVCKVSVDTNSVITSDNRRTININITNLGTENLTGIGVNALILMEAKNV